MLIETVRAILRTNIFVHSEIVALYGFAYSLHPVSAVLC